MNDGTYTIDITMTGGTGKAYINSPVTVTVSGGKMTARFEWSSKNYDLMIVDGEEFLPVNETGNSVFEIPLYTLDEPLSVQAETLAMSEPHLIDYTIVFNDTVGTPEASETAEATAVPADTAFSVVPVAAGGTVLVCAVAVIAAAVTKKRKKK